MGRNLRVGRSAWISAFAVLLAACIVTTPAAFASGAQDGASNRDKSVTTTNDSGALSAPGQPNSQKSKATAESKERPKKPKHLSLAFGPMTLEVPVRVESEARSATPDIGRTSADVEWQDRRLGVQGTAFKRVTFEVSRELKSAADASTDATAKTPWRDVYVGTRIVKGLSVQAGRFKLPFGLEELTGEPNLDFVERSLAARVLSPGRDVGVMTHGRLLNRRVEYQLGYFTRDGDNSRTSQTEGGRNSVAGRLVVAPFAPSSGRASNLEIGLAMARSRLDTRLGLRGRTVLGDGVFFDRVFVNGDRRRVGLEAAWTDGPVGVSGEYITVADERRGMGLDGEDLASVSASAWYVAGTWALTGERKHGRIEPNRDFLRGGFGAIELTARVERLRFEPVTYPGTMYGFPPADHLLGNADRVTTLGVNWYVNHYLKVQSNLINEAVEDPARSPAPSSGGRFSSAVFLFQFRL